MKIFVTQGHQNGIGLEVFFKSLILMNQESIGLLKLLAYKESVVETLTKLQIPYTINSESIIFLGLELEATWILTLNYSQSLTALELGMNLCDNGEGILFTLPTSKDQLQGHAGHTEYFRHFYKTPNLGMFFSSPKLKVLLLSDHVAVKDLSRLMTQELIYNRLSLSLGALRKWGWHLPKVLISGMNPHAGEKGLIGSEDAKIHSAIIDIKDRLKLDVSGPWPGDTMLFEQNSVNDILVYLFHDQGLGVFKSLQGFIGSNITLGLPYLRFSPDHGTSFGLFGKNLADYRGCSFALKEALATLKRIDHGEDSSHQSKSSQS